MHISGQYTHMELSITEAGSVFLPHGHHDNWYPSKIIHTSVAEFANYNSTVWKEILLRKDFPYFLFKSFLTRKLSRWGTSQRIDINLKLIKENPKNHFPSMGLLSKSNFSIGSSKITKLKHFNVIVLLNLGWKWSPCKSNAWKLNQKLLICLTFYCSLPELQLIHLQIVLLHMAVLNLSPDIYQTEQRTISKYSVWNN